MSLKATAAGEGGAPVGGEMSTNAMARYLTGGNESNVVADYRTLEADTGEDVTYVAPTAPIEEAAAVVVANSAPLAGDDSVVTNEDTPLLGTLPLATDVDGDAITYALVGGTTSGTVVLNDNGGYTYTPNANYHGGDSFTYSVTDSNGASNTYTVSIDVLPINDTPILGSAIVGLNETDVILSTGGTLSGVVDPDAGENAYVAQSNVAGTYGVFNLATDGTWSYVANAAYNELNAGDVISDTFIIKSVDGTVDSSVQVSITGTNDTPVASYHEFTTAEDTPITLTNAQLLIGSSDIDANDVLSIDNVALKDPANGTLISNGDGTYTFNPSHNYSGSAIELSYTLTDTSGATSTQDVMIHVTPVADAPLLQTSVLQGDVSYGTEYEAPVFNGHLNAGSTTGNILFDGYTKQAVINVKSYKTSVDDGRIVFLRDGEIVKEFLMDTLLPHANNQPTQLVLNSNEYFNMVRIDNFAHEGDKNAEFKVDSVSLVAPITVEYLLNIDAALSDSSEMLTPVMIEKASLPDGASLYENGVAVYDVDNDGYYVVDPDAEITFTTDRYIGVDEINAISSSVTSWDGADSATTTQSSYNEISGTLGDDTLSGTEGDDLLSGNDGNDSLSGGLGDDFLDGDEGVDALYGGVDDDVLVYDSADSQIDGGDGLDTLLVGDSNIDFNLIDDVKLENIEVIDLSRADVSITNLNPQDVFDMTDDTSTILKIIGDSSDAVASTIIAGEDSPWNVSADQTGVDEGFVRYEGALPDSTPVYIDVQDSIVHTDFD